MKKFLTIALIAMISLLAIAACGDADEESPAATAAPAAPTMAPAPTAAPFTAAPTRAPTVRPSPTAMPTMAPTAASEIHAITDSSADPRATPAPTADPTMASAAGFSAASDYRYQPVSLSAGEVNDNERWSEYLQYRKNYRGPDIHDVDVSERYVITVVDSNGDPVHNADVRVFVGESLTFEGRTYANGQTLFFPLVFDAGKEAEAFTLEVEKDGVSQSENFSRNSASEWNVSLNLERSNSGGVPLDILFLLDATGSMSDEIDQIKATLLSISSRISDLPSQPDLRFGMVAYRDRGDDFVTHLYEFDHDVARFQDTVRYVVADGGGDDPESLNEAYHVAIREPEWRLGKAIRLMFLVADAPPHLDYDNDYSYAVEMMEAHRRGIKTFAIASSGLDEQGEYVFRQIAQHTMGRFVFLLYGPEGSTSHSVGQYTVEKLDDLVVSLVEEELAFLTP